MPTNFAERIAECCRQTKTFDEIGQWVCGELRRGIKHYNWVGIYMIEGGDTLVLKAWDGPAATEHTRIPIGQGICGLAAREKRTIIVDDVRKDPRYLACFLQTRAEIVVPIFGKGEVVGEIDIDSDITAAFGETDGIFLEWVAAQLGRAIERGS